MIAWMKERLLVIVGPTAVGKTEISIELAKRFHGEIISGDSMQVYRGMDIGTAKISREEMQGIPHYMIDTKDPDESFSVAEFQKSARKWIAVIHEKGKLPILVGGTGLYVQAVTHDYQFSDVPPDEKFRKAMEEFADRHGNEALHETLKAVDPESCAAIHPNNRRRVIRALEVYHHTGKRLSDMRTTAKKPRYDLVLIGLTMERRELYERINHRVDDMIRNGLIDEAYRLYKNGIRNTQSTNAIGYKEIYQYFDGHLTKQEAIELLKKNSRRYAKRQLTWFQNKMDVRWFNMSENRDKKKEEIIRYVCRKVLPK